MKQEVLKKSCSIVLKLLVDQHIEDLEKILRKQNRKRCRVWVKDWVMKRHCSGASEGLLKELSSGDPEGYRNHLRMSKKNFDFLLQRVAPYIKKTDTLMRDALTPELKLQVTIHYLATGDSFGSLQWLYRVPKCTISKFLPEVCEAIFSALQDFIKVPNTQSEWAKIIRGFDTRWNFPNCGGAIDGKHIVLRCPNHSGSEFYNYKGTFSIILLALVDDQYCFEYLDVGSNGRASDGGVFSKSSLKNALENNLLNMPPDTVVLGDDAFALKKYLLKPYSHHGTLTVREKIFNYRCSRARRIVENAFGILVSRFRVFERPIALSPEKAELIVKATCALHNWLRKISSSYITRDCLDEECIESCTIIKGSWRKETQGSNLRQLNTVNDSNNYSKEAAEKRNAYADWFMGIGAVPWQFKMILIEHFFYSSTKFTFYNYITTYNNLHIPILNINNMKIK